MGQVSGRHTCSHGSALHLLLSQAGPYLLEDPQYWQREPRKLGSQAHVPLPAIPSEH